MGLVNVISLFGGVALFLYGMTIMGNGLEKFSGGKMERALEKLTNNIFLSVALGAVVTAVIQSSSATTVIVVGLVNAGILQLRQAVGVIMGANIGTTVTAQIIRLSDIESGNIFLELAKPSTLAPLAACIGIGFFMVSKKAKKKEIGQLLLGFAILFSGMFAMEAAVKPLQTSPVFAEIMVSMSNPILGVLAGAIITALIQSSSASVGMLQALASTGVVNFSTAFPIIMGQNIGTCITPILSSIGASTNAKRSALIHLYFNIGGTMAFLMLTYGGLAIFGHPEMWNLPISRTGIANFHTIFNITVTLAFIPFAGLLEKLAKNSIKGKDADEDTVSNLLDDRFLNTPYLALQQTGHVVEHMTALAYENYCSSVTILSKYDTKTVERIVELENTIDKTEDKLEHYLIKLSATNVSSHESTHISELLHLIKDYERIGDYAINLSECAEEAFNNNVVFTSQAKIEIDTLTAAVNEIILLASSAYKNLSVDEAQRVEPLEETIDSIVDRLKDMHVSRLRAGICNIYAGIVFLEILTNLERIADHCSNIAIHVLCIAEDVQRLEAHQYIRHLRETPNEQFKADFAFYMEKYYAKIGGQL